MFGLARAIGPMLVTRNVRDEGLAPEAMVEGPKVSADAARSERLLTTVMVPVRIVKSLAAFGSVSREEVLCFTLIKTL